jgi:hypothetical protein
VSEPDAVSDTLTKIADRQLKVRISQIPAAIRRCRSTSSSKPNTPTAKSFSCPNQVDIAAKRRGRRDAVARALYAGLSAPTPN